MYAKADLQGDAYAQNNLGICYNNGGGGSRGDFAKAAEWYAKAAAQGWCD
jgi:TPR repeat protein